MRASRISVAVAAMAIGVAGGVAAAEKTGNHTLTVISTQARVEISAQGKVLAVQPDPKLPAAVGEAIRSTVSGWKFIAPIKDGQPVGGVTYVQLGACAADVGGGLRMAFDYVGNGPRRDGPSFPQPQLSAAQVRPGQSTKMKLTYRVGADGVAQVESIDRIAGNAVVSQAFRSALQEWIDASTFAPEWVAGEPVATRMSLPMEFRVIKLAAARARLSPKAIEQAFATERSECQAALGHAKKQDKAVAIDSPFKLLPSG